MTRRTMTPRSVRASLREMPLPGNAAEQWERLGQAPTPVPLDVFDILDPRTGHPMGTNIEGVNYPAPRLITTPEALAIWKAKVDAALANPTMDESVSLGVFSGGVTGLLFGIGGLVATFVGARYSSEAGSLARAGAEVAFLIGLAVLLLTFLACMLWGTFTGRTLGRLHQVQRAYDAHTPGNPR